jgi:FkbM family methyltransferase
MKSTKKATITTKFWSQCGEDKYLQTYFIKNKLNPTKVIVEIGAGLPEEFSNSNYFISNGWKACLIEPNFTCFTELNKYYKNNKKVKIYQVLIGEKEGVTKLDIATNKHWALGKETSMNNEKGQVVGKNTLTNILDNYGEKKIGILSIDIEGGESNILKQMINSIYRPEFLLVESLNEKATKDVENVIGKEYNLLQVLSFTRVYKCK